MIVINLFLIAVIVNSFRILFMFYCYSVVNLHANTCKMWKSYITHVTSSNNHYDYFCWVLLFCHFCWVLLFWLLEYFWPIKVMSRVYIIVSDIVSVCKFICYMFKHIFWFFFSILVQSAPPPKKKEFFCFKFCSRWWLL